MLDVGCDLDLFDYQPQLNRAPTGKATILHAGCSSQYVLEAHLVLYSDGGVAMPNLR